MEVTKSNFNETLPMIKQAIEECTFLAIDTEMTGLHIEHKTHSFDTMEERYQKMCETAKNFLVIQVGISCFQYQESSKMYTHKDFNFYTFPSQHCPQAPDTFFTCSASSLNFLLSNGFDFNKLLKEGISYLTPPQEEKLRQHFKGSYEEKLSNHNRQCEEKDKGTPTNVHVPDDHKDFINDIHKRIQEYVESDSKEPLNLPSCAGYRRKLIYQTVAQKYPTGLSLNTTNETKCSYITVVKLTNEDKLLQIEQKHATDMQDLDNAVGFRKVLDIISNSKKLILGHNMLLDLFHVVNQFFFSAPPSLAEFKEMIRCLFPHVADTKTLASVGLKSYSLSTSLFDLWEEIQVRSFPQPKIQPVEGFECYSPECEKQHEAGYDAFMTAAVFVSLIAKLGEDHKLDHVLPGHKILNPYVNRPYIMRHYDMQFLNLNGPDAEANRDNVFYVTFPKEWKTIDLVELFLPYGEIYVSWLNDCSAFVALKSPEQSINVRRVLLKQQSTIYKVCCYADYHEKHSVFKVPPSIDHKSGNNRHVNSGTPLKKKRGSSPSTDGVASNRSITPIIEEEEELENNNSDRQDNCVSTSHDLPNSSSTPRTGDSPKPKRQKVYGESGNPEVSSTDKMFEEPDVW